MYREYENPFELEDRLREARKMRELYPDDIDYAIEVHDLEARVNFAWQDDEYASSGYDEY